MEELVVPSYRLHGISFGLYMADEIRRLSVKEVTNPQTFDTLLHPTYGGLHDPAFGPPERADICETCGLGAQMCPGHLGHVVLPLPVYNAVFFKTMFSLLRGSCFSCHHLLVSRAAICLLSHQMAALAEGVSGAVAALQEVAVEVTTQVGAQSSDLVPALTSRLDACLQDALQDSSSGGGGGGRGHGWRVKNATGCRERVIARFIAALSRQTSKKCLQCQEHARPMRAEGHAKIFLSPLRQRKPPVRRKSTPAATDGTPAKGTAAKGTAAKTTAAKSTEAAGAADAGAVQSGQSYLTPAAAKAQLRLLWSVEHDILKRVFGALDLVVQATRYEHPTDIFFLDVLPVPPSRFRPILIVGPKKMENPQTAALSKVVHTAAAMKQILAEIKNQSAEKTEVELAEVAPGVGEIRTPIERLQTAWIQLQEHVNCVSDGQSDKISKDPIPGIKQLLEKKDGLFRKHMMGKRVDFACRSVISPDPYIGTGEIGVPDVFAKKLTYPQPVTPWNVQQLRQMVINGPNVHPGANFVVNQDGRRILLDPDKKSQREAIAKQLLTPTPGAGPLAPNKQVCRHLRNGDVMLLNRQPTLHRPSIQAHQVRVLAGEKTLRLHYANCKAYNADFDGDEMNAHFPQNEVSRAEAYNLVATDRQYLVPKDGTPLAGLIQDHMIGGVHLTVRGRFFTADDYQQLVYMALTDRQGRVRLLPPAIRRPVALWSGKQVLSTVLINTIPEGKPLLNLVGRAKIMGKNWCHRKSRPWFAGGTPLREDEMGESEVIIHQGELLVGVLDKAHYGPTPYGLVHACYELYGGMTSGRLLTSLAKLFTAFLQIIGFTFGVEDILVTDEANRRRQRNMQRASVCGHEVAARALGVDDPADEQQLLRRLQEAHFGLDDGPTKDLDLCMKGKTDEYQNKISRAVFPRGLHKQFPENNLQLMVQSGAKGSTVNCMQISCLLGQIELEGRRPPLMLNGRSLPSFAPHDTSPRAGGFIDGRFLTGIRPQEYFFHCMAGREGLVDTAVKTSRSGYLQRCIVKHLEGITVNYDMTVRDSDGSVVQFQYGEDGIDISKKCLLDKKQFSFLIRNEAIVMDEGRLKDVRASLNTTSARRLAKKVSSWKQVWCAREGGAVTAADTRVRMSPFMLFAKKQQKRARRDGQYAGPASFSVAQRMQKAWHQRSEARKRKYVDHGQFKTCPPPVASTLQPDRHFEAISELLEQQIDHYWSTNPDQLLWYNHGEAPAGYMSGERFKTMMNLRVLESYVHPGEGVGLLAAQSIGEPSTQMTLNTFHFAGRGEMNMTLGIPRLREVLMVAGVNIATPTMDVCLRGRAPGATAAGQQLKMKLNRVLLSQVLEDAEVTDTIRIKNRADKCWECRLRLSFLPAHMYASEFAVTPPDILAAVERRFLRRVQDAINRKITELKTTSLLSFKSRDAKKTVDDDAADDAADDAEPTATAVDDDDDASDDGQDDGDATAMRQRSRQQDENDYDGEEDEIEEMGVTVESDDDDMQDEGEDDDDEGEGDEEGENGDDDNPRPSQTPSKRKSAPSVKMIQSRIDMVLAKVSLASAYTYDPVDELWCEVTYKLPLLQQRLDVASLVDAEARAFVLSHTPGIRRCFLTESTELGQEGLVKLKVDGVNIPELYKYADILDLDNLYSNDIHAMANTYGIEAACRVIVKEVRDVFAGYGIGVDYRHLSLISDYMTFEGVYKPFNRVGIASNSSPLQKMTFETTMHFLRNATIQGECDELKSPSSRLVVGRAVATGTGAFDLVQTIA